MASSLKITRRGTYYYVDATGGNDSNSGLTTALPWQTIAKVNASSFAPGDRVLFKRGETWKGENIVVPTSGAHGRPIVFGTYGSGANPIIDSTTQYTDWTLDSGAIYKRTHDGVGTYQIFENGARMLYSASKAAMVAGSFSYPAGGIEYVWCADSGNPNTGHVIEYAIGHGFNFNGKSNIIVDGLVMTKHNDFGFSFHPTPGSKNITIRNCTSSLSGKQGFGACGYVDLQLDNIMIDHCLATDTLDEAFWMGNGSNITVQDCEISYVGRDVILKGYPTSGVNFHRCCGILFGIRSVNCKALRNYIHDSYMSWGIYIEYEPGYARPTGTLIEGNLIDLAQAATLDCINNMGDNTIIRNNDLRSDIYMNVRLTGGDGAQIIGNTMYNNAAWAACVDLTAGTNTAIKNNLMCKGAGKTLHLLAPAAGQTGLVSDYNVFAGDTINPGWRWTTTNYTTLAAYQAAAGQDAHSVRVANPLVVAYGTDFHLAAGSAAISAGIAVAEFTHDYDQVVRGVPPSVGAYEYVA